jgi:hypothetical protein
MPDFGFEVETLLTVLFERVRAAHTTSDLRFCRPI